MIGRRSVMRLLAGAPFVGKLAGENAALALMQAPLAQPPRPMGFLQSTGASAASPVEGNQAQVMTPAVRRAIFKAALGIKDVNAEYEAILYARNRRVLVLDSDLAVNKSYSLAAKICYQRQRNVAIDRRDDTEIGTWERANQFALKVLSGGAL